MILDGRPLLELKLKLLRILSSTHYRCKFVRKEIRFVRLKRGNIPHQAWITLEVWIYCTYRFITKQLVDSKDVRNLVDPSCKDPGEDPRNDSQKDPPWSCDVKWRKRAIKSLKRVLTWVREAHNKQLNYTCDIHDCSSGSFICLVFREVCHRLFFYNKMCCSAPSRGPHGYYIQNNIYVEY
jgi:hypothetical protein